jgi:hypothetical protein
MNRKSVLRFGGASAVAVGILYLLVGATHFLLPRAQLRGAGGVNAHFFESLAEASLVFSLHYRIVVILSLLSIAVLLALFELLRSHRTGVLSWAAVVGVIGAALSTIDFAFVGVEVPRIAKHFVNATPAAQSAILLTGIPHLDPCFFAMGLTGIWALVSNYGALRARLIPKPLAYIGLLGGGLFELVFLGAAVQAPLLVDVSVGLGGLLVGPVWYIWIGIVLRAAARREPTAVA